MTAQLVEAHLSLVKREANQLSRRFPAADTDALVSDGTLAMLRVASCYDAARGSFRTVATKAIRNAMFERLRADARYRKMIANLATLGGAR